MSYQKIMSVEKRETVVRVMLLKFGAVNSHQLFLDEERQTADQLTIPVKNDHQLMVSIPYYGLGGLVTCFIW